MISSSIVTGTIGVGLLFLPLELLEVFQITPTVHYQLTLQLLGGMYFAFTMLNWMSKGNMIGGIYNRPIAIANFTHYFIGSTTFIKAATNNMDWHYLIWILIGIYVIFGIFFGIILFRHPVINNAVE